MVTYVPQTLGGSQGGVIGRLTTERKKKVDIMHDLKVAYDAASTRRGTDSRSRRIIALNPTRSDHQTTTKRQRAPTSSVADSSSWTDETSRGRSTKSMGRDMGVTDLHARSFSVTEPPRRRRRTESAAYPCEIAPKDCLLPKLIETSSAETTTTSKQCLGCEDRRAPVELQRLSAPAGAGAGAAYTKAACLVLWLGVFLGGGGFGSVGVQPVAGALMTDAQCVDATILGLDEELSKSPRSDTSTEAVAVGIEQYIVSHQETYDRLVMDQSAITTLEGRELPALRNLWSDRLWRGTATVTFEGTDYLASYMEGMLPEFKCMNEHYGLEFVKGVAEEGYASGTLTSEKVLNWSVLGPTYTALEGIDAFEPTSEDVVGTSTVFVAARREEDESYHYFLSEPASEVESSSCPEPCEGSIITYYWSLHAGSVFLFDRAFSEADPYPCWLPVYEEVEHGPPVDGVTGWDTRCLDYLIEKIEEAENNGTGVATPISSSDTDVGAAEMFGDGFMAALIIPAVILFCVCAGVGIIHNQSVKKRRKMRTTDEAWGVEKDNGAFPGSNETSPDGAMPSPALMYPGFHANGAPVVNDGTVYPDYPRRMFTEIAV